MSEYITYLLDELSPIGNLHTRKMFGGYGLFYHATMIGIISDDELYLKGTTAALAVFTANHCQRFGYLRGDKYIYLNYYSLPVDALDDTETLLALVRLVINTPEITDSAQSQ